jgi:hypothetical protein
MTQAEAVKRMIALSTETVLLAGVLLVIALLIVMVVVSIIRRFSASQ